MAVYDFFLSRNGAPVTAETYVGHTGRLFYDDSNGVIRLSDGVTPGGLPIPVTLATTTIAGAVKLGPGVELNSEGQIVIDPTGLDFSFGDFESLTATYPEGHPKAGNDYAILKTINLNEDAIIASSGTGSINVVGEFRVYPTNGDIAGSLVLPSRFRVTKDGQVRILIPAPDDLAGGVQIVGNNTGVQQDPVNSGVMLHITGLDGDDSRSYVDAVGGYAGFVGRRLNGTSANPTGVLANDEVTRFAANVYANDTGFGERGIGQLRWYASENITSTNKGGRAEFWVTPVGEATTQKIVTVDGVGVTTDRLVKARNYEGAVRDLGSIQNAATITIDFATDHTVFANLLGTATVAFTNIAAGRSVTVILKNVSGGNRAVTFGVDATQTSNGTAVTNVNNNRTGQLIYNAVGTDLTDVYCIVNFN
jgi:hypothetical protein